MTLLSPYFAKAVKNTDLDLLARILSQDPNLNATDVEGRTPLMLVSGAAWEIGVHLVLSDGAEVDQVDSFGRSALHYAASAGDVPTIELLLAFGADLYLNDRNGRSPLRLSFEIALASGRWEVVVFLVFIHLDEYYLEDGRLHIGTDVFEDILADHNSELFAVLLESGLNPDTAMWGEDNFSSSGEWGTLLYWAASNGMERALRLLLRYGADPNSSGSTKLPPPLLAAYYNDHQRSVRLLRDAGCATSGIIEYGDWWSYFLEASTRGDIEAVQDTASSVSSDELCFALHHAIEQGNKVLASFLIEAGADILNDCSSLSVLGFYGSDMTFSVGTTPLVRAFEAGYLSIAFDLLAAEARQELLPSMRSPTTDYRTHYLLHYLLEEWLHPPLGEEHPAGDANRNKNSHRFSSGKSPSTHPPAWPDGFTTRCLAAAVRHGYTGVATFLLGLQEEPNLTNTIPGNATRLQSALTQRHVSDTVCAALTHAAHYRQGDHTMHDPARSAAWNSIVVELLLRNEAVSSVTIRVPRKSPFRRSELILAIVRGDATGVCRLLAQGADPNARCDMGWTPLMYVAWLSRIDALWPLIMSGADHRATRGGLTAQELAIRTGDQQVLRLLTVPEQRRTAYAQLLVIICNLIRKREEEDKEREKNRLRYLVLATLTKLLTNLPEILTKVLVQKERSVTVNNSWTEINEEEQFLWLSEEPEVNSVRFSGQFFDVRYLVF